MCDAKEIVPERYGDGEAEETRASRRGVCPIMSAHTGGVLEFMGDPCNMYIRSGTNGLNEDACGFRLLSLYATFEMGRINRYTELAE